MDKSLKYVVLAIPSCRKEQKGFFNFLYFAPKLADKGGGFIQFVFWRVGARCTESIFVWCRNIINLNFWFFLARKRYPIRNLMKFCPCKYVKNCYKFSAPWRTFLNAKCRNFSSSVKEFSKFMCHPWWEKWWRKKQNHAVFFFYMSSLMGKMVEKKLNHAVFFLSPILYFFSAKPDAREQNTGGHQREAEWHQPGNKRNAQGPFFFNSCVIPIGVLGAEGFPWSIDVLHGGLGMQFLN